MSTPAAAPSKAARPRGRPRVTDGRTVRLTLNLTPAEAEKLERLAASDSLRPVAWLVQRIEAARG